MNKFTFLSLAIMLSLLLGLQAFALETRPLRIPADKDPVYRQILQEWRTGIHDADAVRAKWRVMHEEKLKSLDKYRAQKFGMMMHWGLYSAYGGKYPGGKGVPYAEWIAYNAEIPFSEYDQTAKQFNPVNFDPDAWVRMAKDAGMKYIYITAKHHDGFAMFDSAVSNRNIVAASPYGRDVIAMLRTACKKQGLDFGVYYSHRLDWCDGPSRYPSDGKDKIIKNWGDTSGRRMDYNEYFEKKSLPQLRELLTQYPDMNQIWFDIGTGIPLKDAWACYELVHAYQPHLLCGSRIGAGLGDFVTGGDNSVDLPRVRKEAGEKVAPAWEVIGSMNESWGYKSDARWKSSEELVYWLVNITCNGGVHSLNVGPKADGSFDPKTVERLKNVGNFMRANGEAIYGTEPWVLSHEGPQRILLNGKEQKAWAKEKGIDPKHYEWHQGTTSADFWFSKKGDTIYAIGLVAPEDRQALVKSLATGKAKVSNVSLLGSVEKVAWKQTSEGLHVTLPKHLPSRFGYALSIQP